MRIQQIRNATLKIEYAGQTILLDPWLQDRGTGFSAKALKPEMAGIRNPMNDLPMTPEEILQGVDFCLVTHIHPDHFTGDYLPKDIPVVVQSDADKKIACQMGFINITAFSDDRLKIGDITLVKTAAKHGDSPAALEKMGEACGYLLMGENRYLYIAGDTVYYESIGETLERYHPDVIVLNCCEATIDAGRLVMDLADVEMVCNKSPEAVVVATHLDSVNHALLTSNDVRAFAKEKGLAQIKVPVNGEWIF